MTERRVLVTGSTGALGPAVVDAFRECGWTVQTTSRVEVPGNRLHFTGDITDTNLLRRAAEGVETVVHLASLLHISDPSPGLRDEYWRVNVEGTRNVVDAATTAGARQVILFSTIAVYGATCGQIVDETTPPRPTTWYAQSKLDAESIVLDSGIGCVLRLAAVYGGRVKGNYARLVHALQRGRFVPVGAGTNRRTLVYDEDAARAAVVAATTQPMTPGVYNVTDGEIHTVTEIVAAISSALGRSPRRFHLPASPVRGVLRLVDIVSRISRVKFPASSATLDKYLEDVAVSGMKARLELGFEPRYSLEEGWRETIRHMAISPR